MNTEPARQLRSLSFGIGGFALMIASEAIFRWRGLNEMTSVMFGSGDSEKWTWWELQTAWTDILAATCLIFVAIAVYLIGKRVDALTTKPPEHPIWKELA